MHEEPTAYRIKDPGVRALFTESARYQSWLDVEAVLAQAQAELGIIPQNAHFSSAEITALLDPSRHIGLCEQFAEREAKHARRVAAHLMNDE